MSSIVPSQGDLLLHVYFNPGHTLNMPGFSVLLDLSHPPLPQLALHFIYVCILMCECVCECMWVGGKRETFGVISQALLIPLRQGLSLARNS